MKKIRQKSSFLFIWVLIFLSLPVPAPAMEFSDEFEPVATGTATADQTPLIQVGSITRINFPVKARNKVLRMKVVANNIGWASLDDRINELRNWFYSQSDRRLILNIDVTRSALSNVPFVPYGSEAPAGASQPYQMIDPAWYDEKISSKAKNYDLVLFLMPAADWPNQAAAGWRTDRNNGPVEMQLRADETERSYSQGYPVSAFVDLARHEVVHAMFLMAGQEDFTHEYYYGAKFDQVLTKLDLNSIKPVKPPAAKAR